MSAAATPAQTDAPDPASADKPTRIGRLLDLVHRLIDYGKELAATLQQHGVTTDLTAVTRAFGTGDIALILACITRGLHRASALEARLAQRAGRPDPEPRRPSAASTRRPRAARPAARHADEAHAVLARLPTPEQIAAQVRRRPIGAVIADICRDLGIVPSHPLWRELSQVIIEYGGNLATLLKDIFQRLFPIASAASLAPFPPSPAPAATGLPR